MHLTWHKDVAFFNRMYMYKKRVPFLSKIVYERVRNWTGLPVLYRKGRCSFGHIINPSLTKRARLK